MWPMSNMCSLILSSAVTFFFFTLKPKICHIQRQILKVFSLLQMNNIMNLHWLSF